MSPRLRQLLLRANAVYLGVASVMGFAMLDVRGVVFATGPLGRLLQDAPYSAIGMVEAHGLAFILSLLFWRAAVTVEWHLTAAATSLLLGTANLVFWDIFPATDSLGVGYGATALHATFGLLELAAAAAAVGASIRVESRA